MHLADCLMCGGLFLFLFLKTPHQNGLFFCVFRKGGLSMTTQEVILINNYRRQGLGYKKIAAILELPANSVKTYIRRHPLDETSCGCLNCGAPIEQTLHHRPRKYCSDRCRLAWWHTHQSQLNRSMDERTCTYCGRTYSTHKKAQRFCSRECYANSMRKEG